MRKKSQQNTPSCGWWYARGSGSSRESRFPVEAMTAGDAIRQFGVISDELTIYGPFGSKWEAWASLQEWLAALPKETIAEETRDKAGP